MKIKIHTFKGLQSGGSVWTNDHIEIIDGLTKKTPVFIEEFDELIVDSERVLIKGGLGTAVAGGLLFGGAGAVAGAVLGRGNKKMSTIEVTLLDGRAFMADVDIEFLATVKSTLFLLKGKSREERLEIVTQRRDAYEQKGKKKWVERAIFVVIVVVLSVYLGTMVS